MDFSAFLNSNEKNVFKRRTQSEVWEWLSRVPVLEHVGYGFEAASGHPPGTRVAAIHSPVQQVALIRVQLQQQCDCFTAQLMNLGRQSSRYFTVGSPAFLPQ